MIEIKLFNTVGVFAENKDFARDIRREQLVPAINNNEDIILDFENIDSATQSFIHALISELIRDHGSKVLDKISFKNCNNTIKQIINIVLDYMQQIE